MNYNKESMENYIEKCFQQAFLSEEKDYKPEYWNFKYILLNYDNKGFILVPVVITCKYARVLRKVTYRLKNNLWKNFGIDFCGDSYLTIGVVPNSGIDYNFTRAMVTTNGKNKIAINVYNDWLSEKEGETMPAFLYEQICLGCLASEGKYKIEDGYSVPESLKNNWNLYKEIYEKRIGEPINKRYEIICGPGVTLL